MTTDVAPQLAHCYVLKDTLSGVRSTERNCNYDMRKDTPIARSNIKYKHLPG
jgi:hypothetical protein